jgi:hypothetical protein
MTIMRSRRPPRLAMLLVSSFAVFPCALEGAEKVLRAGARSVDISPKKFPVRVSGGFLEGSADRLQDPLHARCLVLDDGATRLAIAVVDSLMLPRTLIDEVKALAGRATGIPAAHIHVAATHTHSAPAAMPALGTRTDEEYARDLPERIARGIEAAAADLVPAEIGWASAVDAADTHCRRWILRPDRIRKDPFGSLTVRAMMHPGYRHPDFVGPSGPAEDEVWVLSVRSASGRPLALLANYSMHYAGAAPVSADYYAVFAAKIGEKIGATPGEPPFVGILSQGTAGDQHWMDYAEPEKPGIDRKTIAEGVARAAAEAYRKIEHRPWAPLAARQRTLRLRVRAPDEARLAWARPIAAASGDGPARTIEEVYAREQLLLAANPEREIVLQVLGIGDLGIAGIPAEVFAVTGLEIKARSPFPAGFVMELASGAEGYIPPPAQHLLGGYTTWPARTACLEVDAEPRIVETVLGLLEEASGKKQRTTEPAPCAYAEAVLASEPIASYRLDEFRELRAASARGGGWLAIFEGPVAFHLEGPPLAGMPEGRLKNRCVALAGGGIALKMSPPEEDQAWSVELWIWNGLPDDARPVTGVLVAAPPTGERLWIGGTSGGQGRLCFSASRQGPAALEGKRPIGYRTWRHVVLVRETDRATVFLDGDLEVAGPIGRDPGNPADIRIGFPGEGDPGLEGRVDEIAVYRRTLKAEEIARHFRAAR